ncbi:MAG: hypothetical protein AMJ46_02530 [Latescibacteria bacterium DG_63]|nr:MAG: hypothetical protein AMJ46_02530 [Latescibacteria bacterium DG_63]
MRGFVRVRRIASAVVAASVIIVGLTDASAAVPTSTSVLMRKATKEFLSGDFAAASPMFYELLKRDLTYPQLREVLVSLGESTLRESKLAEAESVAVQAGQRLTDESGLERIGFLKGEIYYFSGRIDRALEEFLTFLEVNPESPRVNDVIARLLVMDENGDFDRVPLRGYSFAEFLWFANMPDSALTVLGTLLSAFPDAQIADDALMRKGDILNAQKRFSEAVAEYDSLEARFPESHLVPVCKLKTAEIYLRQLKEEERAITEYEEIVTGFPETSFAVEARSLLQGLRKE